LNYDLFICIYFQLFIYPFIYLFIAFSALTLLVEWQEGHPAYKN